MSFFSFVWSAWLPHQTVVGSLVCVCVCVCVCASLFFCRLFCWFCLFTLSHICWLACVFVSFSFTYPISSFLFFLFLPISFFIPLFLLFIFFFFNFSFSTYISPLSLLSPLSIFLFYPIRQWLALLCVCVSGSLMCHLLFCVV